MGETSQLMGYRIELAGHPGQGIPMIRIEAASAIGGEGSLTPGRCLLQHPDPAALVRELCPGDLPGEVDHAKCNVEVTAFDDGDWWGDQAHDGENDRWTIAADDVVALICSTDIGLIGQARLTFTEYGIKEGKE